MANRSKLITDVARSLRPDVFRWTKANYDADLSLASWNSLNNEQQRLIGIVGEVLLNVEKCGWRIFDPNTIVNDENIKIFEQLPKLYPNLEIHKKFRGKFFKRTYKSRNITD
jgi:hypothetical protein